MNRKTLWSHVHRFFPVIEFSVIKGAERVIQDRPVSLNSVRCDVSSLVDFNSFKASLNNAKGKATAPWSEVEPSAFSKQGEIEIGTKPIQQLNLSRCELICFTTPNKRDQLSQMYKKAPSVGIKDKYIFFKKLDLTDTFIGSGVLRPTPSLTKGTIKVTQL